MCLYFLDQANEAIEAMREAVDATEPDSPQAFLEAYMDAQDMLSKSLHEAVAPLLNFRGQEGE
jgi:hypothetical protein